MSGFVNRALLLVGLVAAAAPLSAQAPKSEVWFVVCNTLKQGTGPEMMANEPRWARAYEKAGAMPNIGMTNMSGVSQACWMSNAGTYENLEKQQNAAGKINEQFDPATRNYAADTRMYTAITRPDLSTPSSTPATAYRALQWMTFRLRPGTAALFEQAIKAYSAAQLRGTGSRWENVVVVQPTAGVAGEVFWVMIGLKSMKELDVAMANDPKTIAAMTPADAKLFQEFFEKAVVSQETELFVFNSLISALPADARKQGGDFWTLPPAGAAAKK